MPTLIQPQVINKKTNNPINEGYLYILPENGPPLETEIINGKTKLKIESGKIYYILYSTTASGADNVAMNKNKLEKVHIREPGSSDDNCEIYITLLSVIYVKFEVWNQRNNTYDPIPSGIDIALVKDELIIDRELMIEQTDNDGMVIFDLNSIARQIRENPDLDLFFIAKTNKRTTAGITLPESWSTFRWKTKHGGSGYFENQSLTQDLGSQSSPLTYRIGVDFHIRLNYLDRRLNPRTAPKSIPVSINEIGWDYELYKGKTDENGEIHGLLFNLNGDQSIGLFVYFEIEDSSFNMDKASVNPTFFGNNPWRTRSFDADNWIFSFQGRTSIGIQGSPEVVQCSLNLRNKSLYVLKNYKELSVFLYYITNRAWTGFDSLTFLQDLFSWSWPVGTVNLQSDDFFNRYTTIHEIAHQIMWKMLNVSTLKIAYEAVFGELKLTHSQNYIFNPEHALIEGWAEFIEIIFGYSLSLGYVYRGTDTSRSYPLRSEPPNTGESVEGAVALGLMRIFENYVVGSSSTSATVQERNDGDISINNAWIKNPDIVNRFMSLIWNPFLSLSSKSDPTSTDYFDAIKAANPAIWHSLVRELNQLNMYLRTPSITMLLPNKGPKTGGQSVSIRGNNFVNGQMEVSFGGFLGTDVNVSSSSLLTVKTPARTSTGSVDVRLRVRTNITSFTTDYVVLSNGYTYE